MVANLREGDVRPCCVHLMQWNGPRRLVVVKRTLGARAGRFWYVNVVDLDVLEVCAQRRRAARDN
eukprot:6767786-Prymnesium_polylepis.2